MNEEKNTYLIPANSKRGLLILNLFTTLDLIILGIGVFITGVLITIINTSSLLMTILVLSPALVAAMLVTPIPNYHNVLVVLTEAIEYFSQRQNYIWKGWNFHEEIESEKKQV